MYLGKIRNRYEQIKELGTEIVAISNDSVESLGKYKAKTQTPFLLLSDESGALIKKYGIKNNWELFHRGVAHPATYIIDRQGVVRFAEVRQNFLLRTKIGTIFDELKKIANELEAA